MFWIGLIIGILTTILIEFIVISIVIGGKYD